jgi:NAD(P)-dependent dehydrogenase (short-subunit alcohol dehydrogenase family)
MDNLFSLEGKTALVIGYAGNLGPIWSKTLERAGADVYGIGMPPKKESNTTAPPYNACDVTNKDDFDKFDHIIPDIMVYNSAIDCPPDENEEDGHNPERRYEEIIKVNQVGASNAIEKFRGRMVANGGGRIILIGSMMGYGPPDESNYPICPNGQVWTKTGAYNDSKRAYLSMMQRITRKYGPDGVVCTVASFGPIDMGQLSVAFMQQMTVKIPTRKFTTIKDLQRTLLFHSCCENFAGQDTLVDGGYRER